MDLRALARLLIELRKKAGNEGRSLLSFITVKEFWFVLRTLKQMTFKSELFSLCLCMGWTMKKVTVSAWTTLVTQGRELEAKEAKTFQELWNANFYALIGCQALKS